jgi:hypothetical protein
VFGKKLLFPINGKQSANIIKTPISVKHASKKAHLSSHQEFFNALEKEAYQPDQ